MEKVQAQLVIVSSGAPARLRQTDHVAVFEPLVAEMYLWVNMELCGLVARVVQLAELSCYDWPAMNKDEDRPKGLDLGSSQRVHFRFLVFKQLPYGSRSLLLRVLYVLASNSLEA